MHLLHSLMLPCRFPHADHKSYPYYRCKPRLRKVKQEHRCKVRTWCLRVPIPYMEMANRTKAHVKPFTSVFLSDGVTVFMKALRRLCCVWFFKISRTEVVGMQIYYHTAVSPLSRGLWCKEVLFFTVSLEKKIKAMLTIGFWYFIKSPIEINLHNLIMLSIWIQKETRDNKAFQSQDNLQKIFGINNQEIESPFIYFFAENWQILHHLFHAIS